MNYSEEEIRIAVQKILKAKQAVLAHTRIVGSKLDFIRMKRFYFYLSKDIKYKLTSFQNESIQIARLISPIAKVTIKIIRKIILDVFNQSKKGGLYDKSKIN